MKTLCIYHTRTGHSEQIARTLAASLGADLLPISDGKAYRGFFGYIAAAVTGLKKRLPDITPAAPPCPLEEYDKIILVAPIWCENVSPVLRAFLAQNRDRLRGALYYVIGSMSGISYLPRIEALAALAGKPYADLLQVKTHKNDYSQAVAAFAAKIKEEP